MAERTTARPSWVPVVQLLLTALGLVVALVLGAGATADGPAPVHRPAPECQEHSGDGNRCPGG